MLRWLLGLGDECHWSMVELLLSLGADVDAIDSAGLTALEVAASLANN